MRPNGSFALCLVALNACLASAQNNQPGYPAPTIQHSGQRAAANPLPPIPVSPATESTHPLNAAWIGQTNHVPSNVEPSTGTQSHVAQANYLVKASASQDIKSSGTRTPLNPTKIATEPQSTGGNTLQMLLSVGSSLLIVIGLFLGVAWCYRKTLNTSMGGIPKQVVSVLGRTAIAPRQQLVLVRFGSKLVLVSLIQGEARAISEITDPLEVDQLVGACDSHQPHKLSNSFRTLLNPTVGGAE